MALDASSRDLSNTRQPDPSSDIHGTEHAVHATGRVQSESAETESTWSIVDIHGVGDAVRATGQFQTRSTECVRTCEPRINN